MESKDRIWKLLADKLANEATEDDLRELDELLRQNPEMQEPAGLIAEWWQNGREEYPNNDARLFEKLCGRLGNGD